MRGDEMPIKVLIVDDSMVFREIIARGIQTDPMIKVVATAVDVFDARDKILEFEPDVVTCDIEMPKMNGIEFIRRLLPQYPIPVIVVSAISDKVFDAMNAGAVDFVTKPSANSPDGVQNFILDLVSMIKAASKAQIMKTEIKTETVKEFVEAKEYDLIAIGASTGGTEAIFSVLKQLPKGLPGIVIVQHIPPVFSSMFAERLNNQTHFSVKEAVNGDVIERNHVYVAPGDKHVQVRKSEKGYFLKVYEGEKVSGHCPSVDVLFTSVAESVGGRSIGVILTGMGYDGAKGITLMRRKGAITLGQDEKSSVVYGMPKAAYELNGISKQVSLDLMGHYIIKYLK
jgi:two-component system, chemotaxis family, protein-glutamate methylesterase/glutaminase